MYGCPRCQQDATELYEKMVAQSDGRFDIVYLQDRMADVYRQYNFNTGKERVL